MFILSKVKMLCISYTTLVKKRGLPHFLMLSSEKSHLDRDFRDCSIYPQLF